MDVFMGKKRDIGSAVAKEGFGTKACEDQFLR
jgi:hypothetical protein